MMETKKENGKRPFPVFSEVAEMIPFRGWKRKFFPQEEEKKGSFFIPETEMPVLNSFLPEKGDIAEFLSRFCRRYYRLSFRPPPGLCRILITTKWESSLLCLPRGSALILDVKRRPAERETALVMGERDEFHLVEYGKRDPLCLRARWSFPVFELEYKLHD